MCSIIDAHCPMHLLMQIGAYSTSPCGLLDQVLSSDWLD